MEIARLLNKLHRMNVRTTVIKENNDCRAIIQVNNFDDCSNIAQQIMQDNDFKHVNGKYVKIVPHFTTKL